MSLNYFIVNFLKRLWFFDISLLYYHIHLSSSITSCPSSRDIYLSLGISLGISWSISLVTVSELFYCKIFETFVVLLAILLPIKSPVDSAVFSINIFEIILSASVADYLARSRSFWLYLPLKVLLRFLPISLPMFLAKDKNPEPYINIRPPG